MMCDRIQEIVAEVLAGELDQYREIVALFEADVWRLAALTLRDRSAAEDVTQDVFVTAYQLLDKYDMTQSFRPWLMGIARNLLRNELRRRAREDARLECYAQLLQVASAAPASGGRVALADAVRQCRDSLAQVAAEAIRWRYDEGLSIEAVAQKLQRSRAATQQLLYRTRIALRDCVEVRLAVMEKGQ
jgi:RNA polymerase sigma-70 factor, ECF subfamily